MLGEWINYNTSIQLTTQKNFTIIDTYNLDESQRQ